MINMLTKFKDIRSLSAKGVSPGDQLFCQFGLQSTGQILLLLSTNVDLDDMDCHWKKSF